MTCELPRKQYSTAVAALLLLQMSSTSTLAYEPPSRVLGLEFTGAPWQSTSEGRMLKPNPVSNFATDHRMMVVDFHGKASEARDPETPTSLDPFASLLYGHLSDPSQTESTDVQHATFRNGESFAQGQAIAAEDLKECLAFEKLLNTTIPDFLEDELMANCSRSATDDRQVVPKEQVIRFLTSVKNESKTLLSFEIRTFLFDSHRQEFLPTSVEDSIGILKSCPERTWLAPRLLERALTDAIESANASSLDGFTAGALIRHFQHIFDASPCFPSKAFEDAPTDLGSVNTVIRSEVASGWSQHFDPKFDRATEEPPAACSNKWEACKKAAPCYKNCCRGAKKMIFFGQCAQCKKATPYCDVCFPKSGCGDDGTNPAVLLGGDKKESLWSSSSAVQ